MLYSRIRICVGIIAALQLGSTFAEGKDPDPVRAPVYRQNGIVSSVPLQDLVKSGNWAVGNENGAWAQYLRLAGITLEAADMDVKKYPPVRCKRSLTAINGQYFCKVPIKVTEVIKNGRTWGCKFGVPGVVYGDGYGVIDGKNEMYWLRWEIDSSGFSNPDSVDGVYFESNGVALKNNHSDDQDGSYKEIEETPDPDSFSNFLGKFKPKLKTKAYYYDINLRVLKGGKYFSCDPIDPIVVNTD